MTRPKQTQVIGAAGGAGSAVVPLLAAAKVHVVATAIPRRRATNRTSTST
jgi:uncharacterized protein YbjT (DUF2867 family)